MTKKLPGSLSILIQVMLRGVGGGGVVHSCRPKKTATRGVVKVKARTRRDGNQHVSAKAWRFQNNLFQSVHSCAAWPQFSTAAGASSQLGFDTRKRRRQALRPASPAGHAGVGGVEKLLKYQTMKMSWGCGGERGWWLGEWWWGAGWWGNIELTSAYPGLREHLQLGNSCEMTLSIGVNWTPASRFQTASASGWSRAVHRIRGAGVHAAVQAAPPSDTRGQWQAVQSRAEETLRSLTIFKSRDLAESDCWRVFFGSGWLTVRIFICLFIAVNDSLLDCCWFRVWSPISTPVFP